MTDRPADARAFSRPTSKAREKRPGEEVDLLQGLKEKAPLPWLHLPPPPANTSYPFNDEGNTSKLHIIQKALWLANIFFWLNFPGLMFVFGGQTDQFYEILSCPDI